MKTGIDVASMVFQGALLSFPESPTVSPPDRKTLQGFIFLKYCLSPISIFLSLKKPLLFEF